MTKPQWNGGSIKMKYSTALMVVMTTLSQAFQYGVCHCFAPPLSLLQTSNYYSQLGVVDAMHDPHVVGHVWTREYPSCCLGIDELIDKLWAGQGDGSSNAPDVNGMNISDGMKRAVGH